jgi:phage baseplate assembly protein W
MMSLMQIWSEIPSVDWTPKLGVLGDVAEGLDDIHQCIRVILSTPKRSIPHRPEFGSDLWRYLDRSISAALPYLVREVYEALELWEPRIKVLGVSAVPDFDARQAPGAVKMTIRWRLVADGSVDETNFNTGVAA